MPSKPTSFRLALLSLAAALPLALGTAPVASAKVAENAPAPAFTLSAVGGQKVSLSQYKGQVVMINFWATWCGPCRQEMPLLDAMYKKYKKMGFTLIGVNVEPDSKAAEAFLKTMPVSFPRRLRSGQQHLEALFGPGHAELDHHRPQGQRARDPSRLPPGRRERLSRSHPQAHQGVTA